MEYNLFKDIIIIFGLAIIVVFVFHKISLPSIIGFLLTGIFAGPYGFKLISSHNEVELLAEIGVILLLFVIGIEFSLKNLLKIRKSILIGGSIQVVGTVLVVSLFVNQLGLPPSNSIFIGFLIALSSTAIVLKLLQERSELVSPHGRIALAILIFQDLIIALMILVIPLLANSIDNSIKHLLFIIAKIIGIALFLIICAKWLIPKVLYYITRTRNRELFIISIAMICLSIAWFTHAAGMSLALGAFLAGLIISESEYSHQVIGDILPFRDLFASFFFVSIGMLFNFNFLLTNIIIISTIFVAVVLIKTIIVLIASLFLGAPLRTSVMASLALLQVGEFSFILSKIGIKNGLLSNDNYQIFLSVALLTMSITPFAMMASSRIADLIMKLPLPKKLKSGLYPQKIIHLEHKKDHLIVVGYGINGRNVIKAAKMVNIPNVIIEMNPETVRLEQKKGESIIYGDASYKAVLEHAGIKNARVVVVAVHDATNTGRIIELARKLNPDTQIIVRTRFIQEVEPLYKLGADEVIPEEYETSIELFVRTLSKYNVPEDDIEKLVLNIRSDGYKIFRNISIKATSLGDLKNIVADIEIRTLRVGKNSFVVDKLFSEIAFRKIYCVTILAIQRNEDTIVNPGGDFQINSDDILFILGKQHRVYELKKLLRG